MVASILATSFLPGGSESPGKLIFRDGRRRHQWRSSPAGSDKCHLSKGQTICSGIVWSDDNNACAQGIIRSFMSIRPGIEVASLSDLGCQRENNEDSYSFWEPANDAEFARKGRLAVVADGMGGHEGGQEASRIAVEVIQEIYADANVTNPQALLTAGF